MADRFGFHALQLGTALIDGLRANRMPQRWVVGGTCSAISTRCPSRATAWTSSCCPARWRWRRTPTACCARGGPRAAARGRLIILGLNPTSLWGIRQRLGQIFLPRSASSSATGGCADWLRLLVHEIEAGRFGLYRPPLRSEVWLERWRWTERIGARWWPVLGAAYYLQAVKRVQGMRLVGLKRAAAATQTRHCGGDEPFPGRA